MECDGSELISNEHKDSNRSFSNNEGSGHPQQGAPRGGAPQIDCISISSDSSCDSSDSEAAPSQRCATHRSSGGGEKVEDIQCFLVESDGDSDYKKSVSELIDEEEEAKGGPQVSSRGGLSLRVPLSTGAVSEVSAGFEFPCIYTLFAEYNDRFFGGCLSHVEVKWSSRMTLCAGLCVYRVRGHPAAASF